MVEIAKNYFSFLRGVVDDTEASLAITIEFVSTLISNPSHASKAALLTGTSLLLSIIRLQATVFLMLFGLLLIAGLLLWLLQSIISIFISLLWPVD